MRERENEGERKGEPEAASRDSLIPVHLKFWSVNETGQPMCLLMYIHNNEVQWRVFTI